MNGQFEQTLFDIWGIIRQGGWIMLAIFIAGQIGWYFIFERWWHFLKESRGARKDVSPAEAVKSKGLFGQVARAIAEARGQGEHAMVLRAKEELHLHVPALSRHLGTLAILAGVAPLLGLAGTVIGIMETFRVITLYGAGNPSMMAGGIAHALVVTEAGLVVAFPILICHDLLQKRADAIEDDAVAGATRLIRHYSAQGSAA
jgi:biopolymer transport protein ExbB